MASAKLTPQEQKALEDLIDKGIENSIQALAKLYHEEWSISSSSFRGGSPEDFFSIFKEEDDEEAGVFFSVQGVPLSFLLIFPRQSIQSLVNVLAKKHQDSLGTPLKTQEAVLGEVGNILVNSFLGKVGDFFTLPLFSSTPHFVKGPRKTLLDATLANLPNPKNNILMAHVCMSSSHLSADCDFLSIFDAAFTRKLLQNLGDA
ncbi:MAG: hypothetical protein HY400_07780 [Elusimicrobia bacterium]|nr:hypothetical protein [Elusimicrobiota bacterium]